jgi:NAD(P)H-hydrate epimerase
MTRLRKEFLGILTRRRRDSHKGDYGHVFVLAGSVGYTGAAALCSHAALLSGSGLVTLGIPKSLNPILEVKLTEIITMPLPETTAQSLSLAAYDAIVDFVRKVDVVAIGPGLSTNPQTQKLVRKLLVSIDKPVVLDADGINALAGKAKLLNGVKCMLVITPHPGEMARLLARTKDEIQNDRKGMAKNFVAEYGVTLVLKGYRTVVAHRGRRLYTNTTGNPGMATAGSGDVLTGMIASLIGQGIDPFEASKLSAYLHGLAGDISAKEKGQISLVAGDILNNLPQAFKTLQSQ